MYKEIFVERSDIVDNDPVNNRAKLADGRIVPSRRISVIAEVAVGPVFEGVSYTGTEGRQDMPSTVVMPESDFIDRPA